MEIVYIGKYWNRRFNLCIRREIYEEVVRRHANYPEITLNSENKQKIKFIS